MLGLEMRTREAPKGDEQQHQEPPDRDDYGADGLQEAVAQRLKGAAEVLDLKGGEV